MIQGQKYVMQTNNIKWEVSMHESHPTTGGTAPIGSDSHGPTVEYVVANHRTSNRSALVDGGANGCVFGEDTCLISWTNC